MFSSSSSQILLIVVLFSGTPIRIERWSPPNLTMNYTVYRSPDLQSSSFYVPESPPRTSTFQRDSEAMEHNDDERFKKKSLGFRLDYARDAPCSGRSEESNAKGADV